jgi:hypothetical protein
MRIFDLDTLLSFAFYPDCNKKRHRNSQEYRLNIDKYSKNDSSEPDNGTIKRHLKNLKVLCLGVANKSESPHKLAYVKLRIEEKKQYKLKKEFQSPNDTNLLPFILFYKKKKVKANLKLIDVLNPFFLQVISLFEQKNLRLKKYGSNKKAFFNIENKYQNQVKQIAENIFCKIESHRQELNIIGLFIDPYFIRKEFNDLVLVDTRPVDTLPRKRKDIQQEPTTCENNINQGTVQLNTDGAIDEHKSHDEFLFLDQLFFEPIETDVENTCKISEEIEKNKLDNLPLNSSDKTSNAITHNTLGIQYTGSFAWNYQAKEKIKNLLKEYQKYLHKSCFFYNPFLTKHKQTTTSDLLNKLDSPSSQAFIYQIRRDDTANILNKHRNFFYFPIFSYIFKTNKKTRGGELLEKIFLNFKSG